MTRIKRILFTLAASLGLLAPLTAPALVGAQVGEEPNIGGSIACGANFEVGSNCQADDGSSADVTGLIGKIINIISLVVGFIAVIMIIVGGVKYITSGGDSGNVTGAKNTILYAVIGLIIVALAQLIVNFVLNTAGDI